MDNVFVFILIFSYFKVPPLYQHRVLFWGILGAIIMRFIMILGGVYLFTHFEFLFLLFGVFLIYTGFKIALSKDSDDMDIKNNKVLNYVKKVLPVTKDFVGSSFVVRVNNKLHVTPLFIVLVLIEQTDLIFALDSIPAIFAITRDPFIVFTSNIFAILGLRSLYFLLADLMKKFVYLKYGIGVILAFVGMKMILVTFDLKIPISWSLLFIVSVLGSSIGYSFVKTSKR
jgi:tellurite resistance protein TerC